MRNLTETVKHLLIINGIFFLGTLILGNQVYDLFALHYPNNPKFEFWQPLTHMFMHGDISHIFFNMFGLWMFGSPLEQMWGKQKFIFFYLSAGFGAAALQLLLYYYQVDYVNSALTDFGFNTLEINGFYETAEIPTAAINSIGEGQLSGAFNAFRSVMVGASGALYGVLVGFAMLFPNAQLMLLFPPIPVRAKYLVPILIFADLFFGFSSYSIGPIAHFAHVGGAVTGLAMMWYWKKEEINNNRWDS
jgi:membrane associated rhomboid family serine protease